MTEVEALGRLVADLYRQILGLQEENAALREQLPEQDQA